MEEEWEAEAENKLAEAAETKAAGKTPEGGEEAGGRQPVGGDATCLLQVVSDKMLMTPVRRIPSWPR
jgi:hypothetical protein